MRRLAIALAGLTVLTSLVSCSGGEVREGSGGPGGEDTFVYSYNLNVVTEWDPALSYSNELIAMQNLYETLTFYDAQTQQVEPRLATKWQQSNGGMTWTFTLREGVKFHSGRSLDSAAAKDAIERTITEKGGPAYIWDAVESIATPGRRTLVFNLSYPAPVPLIASSAYAAYIYDTKAAPSGDLKTWLDKGNDAGSGPYTVQSWAPGTENELRLTAYDDYWGGWTEDQYRDIVYRVTPELTTAWQLLQREEVTFVDRLNPQLFEQAGETDGVSTQATPSFQNLLALYNTQSGPMSDLRVRRAVQLAIDERGLISALKGAGVPAAGLVPKGLLGYTSGIEVEQDLQQAGRLLGQAGYDAENPLTLAMTYAQGDDDQQLFATLLGSSLKQIGVELEATPMQWNAQWSQGKSANPSSRQDIFVMYWYPDYADAYSWFANVFHSATPPFFNLTYLDDPQVDQQIESLPRLTATDRPAAEQSYAALQTKLVEDLAVVSPLFVQNYQRAYRSDVGGYLDNPAYPNVVFVHDLTHA